jgi:hypothetical protein
MKRRRVLQLLLSSPLLPRSFSHLDWVLPGDVSTVRMPDFEIIDPDILCDLAVHIAGLKIDRHFGALRLVRDTSEQGAYLIVTTPPQHLYEEAFFETTAVEPPPEVGQVRGVFANRTRVVLAVRPDVRVIPFNQDALLDWDRYFQTVFPPSNGIPASSIEVPAGLLVAVGNDSKWGNRHLFKREGTGSVKAEQWYARRIPNGPNQKGFTLKPIDTVEIRFKTVGSSTSKCESGPPGGFISSLSIDDRKEIVKTFSGGGGKCASPDLPLADALLLTSSGATLSVVAKHPAQEYGCLLDSWTHRVVNGRDTYARVQIPGFHYPYGIKCTLLKITERRMQPDPKGIIGAFLRKEFALQRVPNAKVKQDFLDMPFLDLSMASERTPALDVDPSWQPSCDEPALKGVLDRRYPYVFRPHVGGTPLRMEFYGHDKIETEQPDLQATSIFVPFRYIDPKTGRLPDELQNIVDTAWQTESARRLRTIYLGGRRIALARESRPGDTQLSTQEIELVRAVEVPLDPRTQKAPIPFWSRMYRAKVEPQALTTMSGQPQSVDITIRKTVDKTIDQERADPPDASFDPEQSDTGVFCRLVQPVPSDFAAGGTNRVGGVITPNISISGLARKTGLASKSALSTLRFTEARGGPLSIGSIFDGLDGKFLGGLHLKDIFAAIMATSVGELPALSYEFSGGDPLADPKDLLQGVSAPASQYPNPDLIAFPAQLKAQLKWRYDWAPDASPVLIFRPQRQDRGQNLPATLFLDAQMGVDLRGGQPLASAIGRLNDFEIAFPSAMSASSAWIIVPFESVEFEVSGTSKPQFRPVVGDIRFGGEFKFIADIAERLKNLGRYKVLVDVDSHGVGVRHSLTIDPIKIGALLISNLSLVYGLRLPFDGSQMLFDVGLATRNDPFTISVSGYAGAGFFRTLLGASGPLALEVSLEFGGNYEANFGGIARGKAYLMAGLYYGLFSRADGSRDTVLEGYVRTGGNLDVLSIGAVSVVAFLRLRYSGGGAEGSVTVSVTVRIALIEVSQHFDAHQRYGGSGSVNAVAALQAERRRRARGGAAVIERNIAGTTFGDTYDESDWHQYWAAFA